MSRNRPTLIIFISIYLFFLGFIFAIAALLVLVRGFSSLGFILMSSLFIGLACLYLMTGIGILRKQRWAKTSSLVIFGLTIFSSLSSLSRLANQGNLNVAFQQGQVFGAGIGLIISGLGLYTMTQDQAVKDYFSRS